MDVKHDIYSSLTNKCCIQLSVQLKDKQTLVMNVILHQFNKLHIFIIDTPRLDELFNFLKRNYKL